MAARVRVEPDAGTCWVWPEHWHATLVFLGMGTQWRVTTQPDGRDRFHGLDYAALGPVLEAQRGNLEPQPMHELMRQVRAIEMAALDLLNHVE